MERDAIERKDRARRHGLLMRFAQLTPRENEVLAHVLRGRLNKQIATDMGINERSVKRHRTSLMHKLGVKSVAELVQIAFEAGMSGEIRAPGDTQD